MMEMDRRSFVKVAAVCGATVAVSDLAQWVPSGWGEALGVRRAYADGADVLLGVFTNSENDGTDTFYMSTDGVSFHKISEAFVNLDKTDPNNLQAVGSYEGGRSWALYSFKCPSIMYHKGVFWMLANEWKGVNGKVALVISASTDLVHWCDQGQILVDVADLVQGNGESDTRFDAVAADWAEDPDGERVHVVISLGYYGAYHGQPENDTMYPYLITFSQLEPNSKFNPVSNPIQSVAQNAFSYQTSSASAISLPSASTNRIDGSLFFEGGRAYLSIKNNGVTNEIWSIGDIARAGSAGEWQLVNGNVLTGYEAPSLAKLGDKYFFYTDELATWTPNSNVRQPYYRTGTNVQSSSSLGSGWSTPHLIVATSADGVNYTVSKKGDENACGPRHGTVIAITDASAKQLVWDLYRSAGWQDDREHMYRLYNANSGEHFYTSSASELGVLAEAGWVYEGIGWTAPVSSEPVYRMYNPNPDPTTGSGEHHYTRSAAERDLLAAAGWVYEGEGWCSADEDGGVPLYRLYNPNAYSNNHHYTTSESERDSLVSQGWKDEGVAWYGV